MYFSIFYFITQSSLQLCFELCTSQTTQLGLKCACLKQILQRLQRLLTYAERRFLHWHHPYPCAGSPSGSSTHFQVLCDHRQLCACYRKIRVNLAKKVKQASKQVEIKMITHWEKKALVSSWCFSRSYSTKSEEKSINSKRFFCNCKCLSTYTHSHLWSHLPMSYHTFNTK